MADKQINLKVVADGDYSDIETLEQKIKKLKHEKLNFRIEADNSKIIAIDEEITKLKNEIRNLSATPLDVKTNMNEINSLVARIDQLEAEKVDIQLDIETAELEKVKDEIQALENEEVEVQLRNQSAMEALDQIGQGFDRLKQGASELGQHMGTLLESAGKQETNMSFLTHALNNDEALAKEKMGTIAGIVQDLPGDDTAVQGLLSQAIAKDASIANDTLKDIGVAYADYASAMSFYGKSGIEAQQDMTNYILAGNTAELERSPILASHIDKLKEATTVQERAKVLQEALNEEHWGGMSQQDTFNNKLETFNGMLERGKYTLGGMFQESAKWGMDFLLNLDSATGGLVGMTIAMAGFATPLVDVAMGIGQIGMGIKGLSDLNDVLSLSDKFSGLKDRILNVKDSVMQLATDLRGNLSDAFNIIKRNISDFATNVKNNISNAFGFVKKNVSELATSIKGTLTGAFNGLKNTITTTVIPSLRNFASSIKTSLVGAFNTLKNTMTGTVIPALRSVATSFLEAGKSALTAGLNALRSAGMWLAQKVQMVASTVASWALSTAQAVLNVIMSMNPIMLVVIALIALAGALIWAYYNVDWFRQMVDGAWQSLTMLAGQIWGAVTGALQWIGSLFQQFTSQLGLNSNNWIQAILSFILFIPQLPLRLGVALANAIAKTLGFGNNFVSDLISAGSRAVSNFISYISQIPAKLGTELSSALNKVDEWASTLPQKFWDAGVNAVKQFLSALGIASPGTMQRMLVWEVSEMGRRVPIEAKTLLTNIGNLGSDVVDEFGNPELNVGFSNSNVKPDVSNNDLISTITGGLNADTGGDTIINVYGDVDNDRRVNQIVEAVRRELNWNNKTAGRTI